MRAVVLNEFGGPEVLRVSDAPKPVMGPDDILIKNYATALNRADLHEREGHYPPPKPAPKVEIPGLECAGEVAAVGERVVNFQVGQRVAALLPGGGYAEWVAAPERMAWEIPSNLSFAEAAAIPEVFLTAYDALFDKAGVQLGDWVIVHAAAGGVGSAAVQMAALAGAHVLATVGGPEKAAFVSQLGAERVVNYREASFAEAAAEWTEGAGVSAILDFVGQNYFNNNLKSLKVGGTLVVIGTLSGRETSVNLGHLLARRLTVRGTALRSRPLEAKMTLVQRFSQQMMPFFKTGRLRPVLDRVLPLQEVAEAHRYMERNQNRGKIVLEITR